MPNKIPSNSLRIFPISHRSPEANCYTDNFITEYNLSSLINRLLLRNYSANGTPTEVTLNGEKVKINGFVISDEIPAAGTQGNFEFNINGYFVSVNMDVLRSSLTSPVTSTSYQDFVWFENVYVDNLQKNAVCAFIKVNTDNVERGLHYIEGSDDTKATFTSKQANYALPLYYIEDGKEKIVQTSKLRLTNFALDDGDL